MNIRNRFLAGCVHFGDPQQIRLPKAGGITEQMLRTRANVRLNATNKRPTHCSRIARKVASISAG